MRLEQFIIIPALLIFTAPSLVQASNYETLKKEADGLYYAGKYEDAKAAYARARALNSQDPELYSRLGDIELKRANIKEGILLLKKAKGLDPDNPENRLALGIAYFEQVDFDQAISEFQETLRLQPTNVVAAEYLGGAYYRTGRLEEAFQTLQSVIKWTPESYQTRYQLGQLYSEKGDYEKAKTEFQKTIDIAPTYPGGYINLAWLETKTGSPDKAIEHYKRAIELSPHDYSLHGNLGYLYLLQKKYAEAVEALTKALEGNPNDSTIIEYKKAAEDFLSKTKARASVQCYPDVPKPQLKLIGAKEGTIKEEGKTYTYYNLEVTNWSAFPAELFLASPDLPPCGKNATSARTWTNVRDPHGRPLKTFCGEIARSQFNGIYSWFAIEKGKVPPDSVFITLWDRGCDIHYVSNSVGVTPPTTTIPDHKM